MSQSPTTRNSYVFLIASHFNIEKATVLKLCLGDDGLDSNSMWIWLDNALVLDKILTSGSNWKKKNYFFSLIQNGNRKIDILMCKNMEEGPKYFSPAHELKCKPCILSIMTINCLCWWRVNWYLSLYLLMQLLHSIFKKLCMHTLETYTYVIMQLLCRKFDYNQKIWAI